MTLVSLVAFCILCNITKPLIEVCSDGAELIYLFCIRTDYAFELPCLELDRQPRLARAPRPPTTQNLSLYSPPFSLLYLAHLTSQISCTFVSLESCRFGAAQ